MANGAAGPIGEMTDTLWNTIKNLKWSGGGWTDQGTTKFLHPCMHTVNFDEWFNFSSSTGVLLKLYMTEADFNNLKSWTFNSQYKAWIDGSGNKYRLKWEYDSGLSKFRVLPVQVQI